MKKLARPGEKMKKIAGKAMNPHYIHIKKKHVKAVIGDVFTKKINMFVENCIVIKFCS